MATFRAPALSVALMALVLMWASADMAPDAALLSNKVGDVVSAEYRFPPEIDTLVLPNVVIEMWAVVYRPAKPLPGPAPVIVFYHGNRKTCVVVKGPYEIPVGCAYSETGQCEPGQKMGEYHLGYGYLAEDLVRQGFIVVSINANRGITCARGRAGDASNNLARGRHILRHLQLLSLWNSGLVETPASLGTSLQGQLDLQHVGLVGHSRGGEGIRAALMQYSLGGSPWPRLVPNLGIKALFELAGSDGQSRVVLNAPGVAWLGLVASCDNDDKRLQDTWPYDRIFNDQWDNSNTMKATYIVLGTNHDYFNTEWKAPESVGCLGFYKIWKKTCQLSVEQRQVAQSAIVAFFLGNLGPNPNPTYWNTNFNPAWTLPLSVSNQTDVLRNYAPTSYYTKVQRLDDFDNTYNASYSSMNQPYQFQNVNFSVGPIQNAQDESREDPVTTAGAISWTRAGQDVWFQTSWTPIGQGWNLASNYSSVSFRMSRQQSPLNGNLQSSTDFTITFVGANDQPIGNAVMLSSVADLRGPFGAFDRAGFDPVLKTAAIPFSYFGTTALTQVRGIRFIFSRTQSGAIFVTNFRVTSVYDFPKTIDPPSTRHESTHYTGWVPPTLPPLPPRPPRPSMLFND